MIIKTTLRFEPSPDARHDVARGPSGAAGYVVLMLIEGEEKPEQVLDPSADSLTVEAEEGDAVQVFISYRNSLGHMSPAREFRFRARPHTVPLPPGELRISRVDIQRRLRLPVLAA